MKNYLQYVLNIASRYTTLITLSLRQRMFAGPYKIIIEIRKIIILRFRSRRIIITILVQFRINYEVIDVSLLLLLNINNKIKTKTHLILLI